MVIKLSSKNWHSNGTTFVRGFCFDNENRLLQGDDLLAYFSDICSAETLSQKLASANGLFAVLINSNDFQALAIDATRIYPLYFTPSGEVSDNPHNLSCEGLSDKFVLDFYKASGATPEGRTLIKNIFQAKPSHYAIWNPQTGWEQYPYQTYCCRLQEEEVATGQQLLDVFDNVAERLIRSCGGRQIVIPLSGGYDSRIIATLLAKNAYTNVITYTVGKKNSMECNVARIVAEALHIPNYAIDITTPDTVKYCYSDKEEFDRYYRYIGGYSNFTWMFEYAAIKKLQQMGVLSSNAVFVPGHSGDFIAGSHIAKAGVTPTDNACNLTRKILYLSNEFCYKNRIRNDIRQYFENMLDNGATPYSAYQNYILQNRQAHNIINSSRVYEFFGYDVRLPLWDRQLMELMRRLPYSQLQDCCLYNNAAMALFKEFGIDFVKPTTRYNPSKTILKHFVKRFIPIEYIKQSMKGDLGEWEVCQPLLDELVENKIYSRIKKPLNSNTIMKEWYLMKVSNGKG
jgi:asparagine synthase (glutamine-hydrolysing)